jgi:PAS domain-containing protein
MEIDLMNQPDLLNDFVNENSFQNRILEILPQPIFILDLQGKYLYFNESYKNWLKNQYDYSPVLNDFFWNGPGFG